MELYRLDPNIKLQLPRSQRPQSQQIFAWSNFLLLSLAVDANKHNISTWDVIRAVEELIKIHAPENWGLSFREEMEQSKKRKSSVDNVGVTAQYLCKSG